MGGLSPNRIIKRKKDRDANLAPFPNLEDLRVFFGCIAVHDKPEGFLASLFHLAAYGSASRGWNKTVDD